MKRRAFLGALAAGASGCLGAAPVASSHPARTPVKGILFDAFPIFDPRPIGLAAEQLFPNRGAVLVETWRARQFEYQWLRALGGRYTDFSATSADALEFALRKLDLRADRAARSELLGRLRELGAWPDVPEALEQLKARGVSLALLSNMDPRLLSRNVRNARLEHRFDAVISTDEVRTYKPDPRAYRLGAERLGLSKSELLFVAFAGWDASGAKWFGYETFWVNRLGSPLEALGAEPDAVGSSLQDLVSYVSER